MSWIHELAPMIPTPRALLNDLRESWRGYRNQGLSRGTATAYCLLRATQRIAYWFGWRAGSKEHRTWTPS